MEWVVRAGIATPDRLRAGYKRHTGEKNPTYGFSVQCARGWTWQALAQAGQFPNGQVSIAYDEDLAQALQPLGYRIALIKTSGTGQHHTLTVLYDASGNMLHRLPHDAAMALAGVFRQQPNPYRVTP